MSAGSSILRHLDIFSGIGGFALAARMAGGIETIAFCEREPYAQRVLRKHWPEVPICNDIHTMTGTDYGTVDLITGGFPCQPYSFAGERRGNEDDRALWPEMLRIIQEARPAWVLGENVLGVLSMALDGILSDLEGAGYSCQAIIIPACGVDAKHKRDRVWIVAHSARFRRTERVWTGRLEAGQPDIDLCGKEGRRRDRQWPSEPNVGRVAHGIPRRVDRLRGLGNAIVPQVAEEILRCIVEIENGNKP